MKDLLAEIKRVNPQRLVMDSLSDLRLIAEDLTTFRRLILAMRREFGGGECTVLLTNNIGQSEIDSHLETICHGVIRLEQVVLGYGPVRRRLLVLKLRGRAYRSGWHDFRIVTGGIRVFPALIAGEQVWQKKHRELASSGNERLDLLFGGGVDRGTTTAIIGASGTGKTTVANQCVVAAAQRGETVAVYLFEETEDSFRERAAGVGLAVDDFIDKGRGHASHGRCGRIFHRRVQRDASPGRGGERCPNHRHRHAERLPQRHVRRNSISLSSFTSF